MLRCKLQPVVHRVMFVNRGEESELEEQTKNETTVKICSRGYIETRKLSYIISVAEATPTWCRARAISKVPTVSMLAAMIGIPL